MRDALPDRELAKFVETPDGETAVRVSPIQSFSPPTLTDAITASYPDSFTEVYEYRQGGIGGTILKTVTIVYTDATKESLQSVVVT